MSQHLLSIDDLSRSDIEEYLDTAESLSELTSRTIGKVPTLRGRTVAPLFFENSTRTRLSFETAAQRLSADVMTFTASSSSVTKGESLRDTALTIQAMGVDALVVRHSSAGAPVRIADWVNVSVINGGDGWHQHPTQALGDVFTLRRQFGQVDGLRAVIVGDIAHSRVARSNVAAFTKMGASVTLVAPHTLLPPAVDTWPVRVSGDLDSVLADTDVVYLLRMQLERQNSAFVPSLTEYANRFGLSEKRAELLHSKAVIMHPGPMNRGVEIADVVANMAEPIVTQQVTSGVAVRMAVLHHVLGGSAT